MTKEQSCQDCEKFVYNFDITLVDELEQVIADVPFKVFSGNSNVLFSGKTDSQGKVFLTNMPPKTLRLVLDTEPFLEVMQQEHRYLRTSRNPNDSKIKEKAELAGNEYSFLKVGNLIEQLPVIDSWPVEDYKNANWIDDEGEKIRGQVFLFAFLFRVV